MTVAPLVVMLVLTDVVSDGRVQREARALATAGWRVTVIGRTTGGTETWITDDGVAVTLLPVDSPLAALQRRSAATGGNPTATRAASRLPRTGSPRAAQRFFRSAALRLHRPWVVWRFSRSALRVVPEGIAVVHAHDTNALAVAYLVARRQGARLVYDAHELWLERNRHGERRALARLVESAVERHVVPRADRVITVSAGLADELQRRYRLRVRPTVLRNVPELRDVSAPDPALRDLTGRRDGRILLYTGRVMSGRGLDQAVRLLGRAPADLSLVLLGPVDEVYLAALRRAASSSGVGDRVRHVGPVSVERVTTVAAAADVALVAIEPVCLSYELALPNKLFEAVHAGVPVLATDLPEIRAFVHESGVGEVFQPGDDASFVHALSCLLEQPQRYRAAAVRRRQTDHWQREQHILVALYQGLARGH